MMSDDAYRKILHENKKMYKLIGKIYCPALDILVNFNYDGWHHLLHDGLGKNRSQTQVIRRLRLMSISIQIIQCAKTITEKRSINKTEYWCISMSKVKVILRRIGNGRVHFYSIMD
jgi:hypothetical protein